MFKVKSLAYLASREAYYHCYGIIDNFSVYCYDHCLCYRYQGCVKKLSARTDYCCVCTTNEYYSLDELDNIKHDRFKLQKFFLSILRVVAEILSLDPTVSFWKSDYYNWICFTLSLNDGVECVDLFRLNLDYYFSLKDIKWHLVDY